MKLNDIESVKVDLSLDQLNNTQLARSYEFALFWNKVAKKNYSNNVLHSPFLFSNYTVKDMKDVYWEYVIMINASSNLLGKYNKVQSAKKRYEAAGGDYK